MNAPRAKEQKKRGEETNSNGLKTNPLIAKTMKKPQKKYVNNNRYCEFEYTRYFRQN